MRVAVGAHPKRSLLSGAGSCRFSVFESGECTLAMPETWEGALCSPCYLEEGVYKPEQRGGFWFLGKKKYMLLFFLKKHISVGRREGHSK